MRKSALTFTVTTLVLGIFGAFFRWLQNANAFDAETGCAIPGHGTSIVFLIYCVLAVAAVLVLTLGWFRRFDYGKDASALRDSTPLPTILCWLLGVVFAAASCVMLFGSDLSRFPAAQRLFGAGGILAGLCLPFLPAKKDGSSHSLSAVAAAAAVIFCCYWLLFCYRIHADDPVIWRFATEILAVAASAAAFYYIAAFHYQAGHGSRALLAVQLAAFFNIVCLFDKRNLALGLMFFITAVLMLLMEYLIIQNMWEKRID